MDTLQQDEMKYDIHLFEQLNEEYRLSPVLMSFPEYDRYSELEVARRRLRHLVQLVPLCGRKVLEIGCGSGYVSKVLASEYNCSVVGVDVRERDEWSELSHGLPNLSYRAVDLSQDNPFEEEAFDIALSYAAWEHLRHPFAMLEECCRAVKSEGHIFVYANQYRSAIASHLYRTVHFPFPHLLFSGDVIAEYLSKNGTEAELGWYYYVNKLTYSHYKEYFRILGLRIVHERLLKRNIDADLYDRFRDRLELYPRFDLELDFFEVLLSRRRVGAETVDGVPSCRSGASGHRDPEAEVDNVTKERDNLVSELSAVSNSISYRLGNLLVDAVCRPGRNTVLLPYRLVRLGVEGLRKLRTR